jgi:hypothetical protein
MAILACLGACGSFLGAFGCKGSEHVVLAPILKPPAQLSGGTDDSGSGGSAGHDSGPAEPIDAEAMRDTAVPVIDSGIDPDLNPDITFDWIETPPGRGMCGLETTFAGSFSCTLEDNPLAPLAGQVSFYLVAKGEGLFDVIGHLADPLGIGLPYFYIGVTGMLVCANEYTFDASGAGGVAFGPPPLGFSATLKGLYDPGAAEIVGDVFLTFDANQLCTGTFSVGASP